MEGSQIFALCMLVFLVGFCFGCVLMFLLRRAETLLNTKDLVEKFREK